MAVRGGARTARSLVDGELGPVLVGLRTLEWRWDRLPAIGIDPEDMLADLADRAAGIAELAVELAGADGAVAVAEVAHRASALHALVAAIADGVVPADDRREALERAVLVATDLHRAAETLSKRGA